MSTRWNINLIARNTRKTSDFFRVKRLQRGVTSIEYALIAALVALAAIGSISSTGSAVRAMWVNNAAEIVAVIARALLP